MHYPRARSVDAKIENLQYGESPFKVAECSARHYAIRIECHFSVSP